MVLAAWQGTTGQRGGLKARFGKGWGRDSEDGVLGWVTLSRWAH